MKNRFVKLQPTTTPRAIQGASVQVRNDDVNGALRKLKKILDNNNRQKDLARHEFYEKPSIKRKRAKAQAVKRSQKEQDKELTAGVVVIPKNLKYLKSRRTRRRVIDAQAAAQVAIKKIKNT